jgi:hypothetical protein
MLSRAVEGPSGRGSCHSPREDEGDDGKRTCALSDRQHNLRGEGEPATNVTIPP